MASASKPEGSAHRPTATALKRAAAALAVHGRLPQSGKPSRLGPSLRSLPRRVGKRVGDTCQAHRCAGGSVGSTRITETELAARNRRAGFPAPLGFADRETKRDSAARGPLQTAAAAQHRHDARGRQVWDQGAAGFALQDCDVRPQLKGNERRPDWRGSERRRHWPSGAGPAPCCVRGASGAPRRSHIATDARCGQRASSVRKMHRRRGGPRRRSFATDLRITPMPN